MDAGLINGVLFLDLCKAFDTVDHKILIKTLFIYGIRNKALLKSYLHNRKQFCVVNNATSYTQKVNCGVPQGSNLGPPLFPLYVNDVDPKLYGELTCSNYTDDTNITVRSSSLIHVEEALKYSCITSFFQIN
jgi:hypothetical protein